MSIKQRLSADMKLALKSKETLRLGCIRMLRSKLLEREVSLRGKHGRDYGITDDEALAVVQTYAKQRRDSIEAYREGGRDDLADREQAELEVIQAYLPQQLGDDELTAVIREAVAEAGAASPADMGAVMKLVMPRVKGRADGKRVNRILRGLLEPS
jgi:uncharacterized protein YqeY